MKPTDNVKEPLFRDQQAEEAFRVWQNKNYGCLMTNWVCSTEKDRGVSYDSFSLLRYTGRLTFKLSAEEL